MNEKEFRVGNIVKCSTTNNEYDIIQEIGFSDSDRGYYLRLENVYHGVWLKHDKGMFIESIPLTEAWLDKLGFIQNKYRLRYELEDFCLDFSRSYGSFQCWESETSLVIKSIHQIQNLYFALTAKELELTKDNPC